MAREHSPPHPVSPEDLRRFPRLGAAGLHPDPERPTGGRRSPGQLLLTCADSRALPGVPTNGGPDGPDGAGAPDGLSDLFIVRNIGNLIPLVPHPTDTPAPGDSVGAAIEYAVAVLDVRTLTVCGHSGCGAMRSLLHGAHRRQGAARTPLTRWLRHGQDSLQRSRTAPAGFAHRPAGDPLERLCLTNIEQQVENLRAHPAVRRRLREGRVEVAGMYLDLARTQAFLLTEAGFTAVDDRVPERLAEKV